MDLVTDTTAARHTFADHLRRETWGLYAGGIAFIILRTIARLKRTGIKGLTADDYLIWVAALWYTLLVVCLNITASIGGSNLYPVGFFPPFSEAEIKGRIKGSKAVVVSEQAMLNVIYTLKACMLLLYSRLTLQLRHRLYVKILAVYVGFGYFASQLAFFLECRPFNGYWQVPAPKPQCATLEYYAIIQGIFNVSSDVAMLAISLPLLSKLSFPLRQKLVLLIVFGLGIFVILAAVLTKYFNLSEIYSTRYMFWYVREASTAVYVTNLPVVWPLFRDAFPFLRSFCPYGNGSSRGRWRQNNQTSTQADQVTTIGGGKTSVNVSVADYGVKLNKIPRKRGESSSVSLESDERALYAHYMGGISQETTVEVEQGSIINAKTGDLGEMRRQAWEQDHNDGVGYQAQVQGGGAETWLNRSGSKGSTYNGRCGH